MTNSWKYPGFIFAMSLLLIWHNICLTRRTVSMGKSSGKLVLVLPLPLFGATVLQVFRTEGKEELTERSWLVSWMETTQRREGSARRAVCVNTS